mgnify:CR=1 FL=1
MAKVTDDMNVEGRDKVKLTVTFRGREIAHQEIGHRLIQKVIAALADVSTVESPPRSEGRTLTSVLMPKQQQQQPKSAPRPESRDSGAAPAARAANPATRVETGSKE